MYGVGQESYAAGENDNHHLHAGSDQKPRQGDLGGPDAAAAAQDCPVYGAVAVALAVFLRPILRWPAFPRKIAPFSVVWVVIHCRLYPWL